MLEIENVIMQFGGLFALNGINMSVEKKTIRGLIGPNGSGKTTLLNVITGFYTPTSGSVLLQGNEISGKPINAVSKCGLARTFQNIALFSEMTALENVVTAACVHQTTNLLSTVFQTSKFKNQEQSCYEKAQDLLNFVGLENKANTKATNLPYGQQRLLEIARAMATNPKILLLDEPVAGMNDQETAAAANLIKKLHDTGLTIILIEHHMKFVMELCDKITVLNSGKKIAEGTPNEIQNNSDVIECYLGKRKGG
jgi:branched-chain amino acid transport system ATP-binding protein